MGTAPVTRKVQWGEVSAVVATGLAHLVVSNALDRLGVFVAGALLFWGGYVIVRVRRDRGVLADWGFRRENLRPAFRAASAVALVAVLLMAGIAALRGSLALHVHLLPLFLLYPVWGLAEQYFVQALVARNLRAAGGLLAKPRVIVPVCAVLLAVVHLPDPVLTLATLLLGGVFTAIYLRWRNLWPLGLYHGWLGALCYFWILGHDPWLEVVG
ncbi:MAG: type II CAAX prenyl endopeptidase Rce1 family protein [Planctomycetota bacterium]